jgi:DMSO/TMAO reductase YedYZ molybdopterin-dependent catalytic subunit
MNREQGTANREQGIGNREQKGGKRITRREAIEYSCLAAAGLSVAALKPEQLLAQAPTLVAQAQGQAPAQAQAQQPWPDTLVERPVRNIAPLPLNADGSAPEHPASAAGAISDPSLWRYNKNEPPQIDYDFRNLRVKLDSRGHAKKMGTLTFADLDPLPRHSGTYLLQCGAPNPRGIVKWTGVRFSDFAEMIGIQPFAHYARILGADRFWMDEEIRTLLHPQVMLVWLMNDQPIAPKHGAPLRLIIPFRYGAHHVKAVSEIILTPTGFPLPSLPA